MEKIWKVTYQSMLIMASSVCFGHGLILFSYSFVLYTFSIINIYYFTN